MVQAVGQHLGRGSHDANAPRRPPRGNSRVIFLPQLPHHRILLLLHPSFITFYFNITSQCTPPFQLIRVTRFGPGLGQPLCFRTDTHQWISSDVSRQKTGSVTSTWAKPLFFLLHSIDLSLRGNYWLVCYGILFLFFFHNGGNLNMYVLTSQTEINHQSC